jgi:hypothetical protein
LTRPRFASDAVAVSIVLLVIELAALYTVAVLDFPFNGGLRVGPEAFDLVLRRMEGD